MHSRLAFTVILAIGLLEGCGATDICACTPGSAVALLVGRVTSPEGAGVPGAHVSVAASTGPGCPTIHVEGAAISEPAGVFGTAGHFRLEVRDLDEVVGVCLAVQAQPPLDSTSLRASAVEHVVVDLAFADVPDSTEVQLVLTR